MDDAADACVYRNHGAARSPRGMERGAMGNERIMVDLGADSGGTRCGDVSVVGERSMAENGDLKREHATSRR